MSVAQGGILRAENEIAKIRENFVWGAPSEGGGVFGFFIFSVVPKRLEMPLFTDVFENIDVKYFLFHFYDK